MNDPFRPLSDKELVRLHYAITDDDMKFRGEGALAEAVNALLRDRGKESP